MKNLITICILLFGLASTAVAAESVVYEGTWNTTNRKLDGTMTCVVTERENEQWQGRFYGVWQGVAFDYTVAFAGPPDALHGSAQVDGADYTWKGRITKGEAGSFVGNFGGNRYSGSFDLKEKRSAPPKKR
jgi:hypothetical protein